MVSTSTGLLPTRRPAPARLALAFGDSRAAAYRRGTVPATARDAVAVTGRCHLADVAGTGRLCRQAGGPTAWSTYFRTCSPLPTTVTPPSETVKPRARSSSLFTPISTPSPTTTFLSRMASRITARRPISVWSRTTDRSTVAQLCTRTPGERTDSRTPAPDTITPLDTTLSIARPTRSPSSWTNLAGGCDGMWVRIGHRSL